MAVPTFFAAGSPSNSTTSVTPGWPSSLAIGDVGFLLVESANQSVTLSSPQGFQLAFELGTGTAGDSTATRLTVFWRRLDTTSPTNPTVADAGDHVQALIVVFRGCVRAGIPWDTYDTIVKAAGSSSSTFPDVATKQVGGLAVLLAANGSSSAFAEYGITASGLDSFVEQSDAFTTTGNGGGILVGTGTVKGASTGQSTSSFAFNGQNGAEVTATLVLRNDNAPVYVGQSTFAISGTTIQPSWPGSIQVADVGLLLVESANETVTLSTPAGFQLVGEVGVGTAGSTTATRLTLFWCRTTSTSPPNPTIADAGDHIAATLVVYRNVVRAGIPWTRFSTTTKGTPSTTTTFPSIDAGPNALIMLLGVNGQANSNTGFPMSPVNSNLEQIIVRESTNSLSSGNGGGLSIIEASTVAPQTGVTTATVDNSADSVEVTMTLELLGDTAPKYFASGSGTDSTTTISPAWPSNVVAGDIGFFVVESANQAVTLSTPAGFELAGEVGIGTAGSTASTRLSLFWCRASSTSPASPTVADPGDHLVGQLHVIRGCARVGVPWTRFVTATKGTPSTTTTFPEISVSQPGAMLLLFGTDGAFSGSARPTSPTNSNMAGLTVVSALGLSGNGGNTAMVYGNAPSGPSGLTTATTFGASDGVEAMLVLELKSSPYITSVSRALGLSAVQRASIY